MKEVLQGLKDALARREDTVLALIIESRGSSPRKTGALMLCGGAGRICGTIGGGITEHLAAEEAKTLIREKRSAFKEYFLHPNDQADIGAQCGGEFTLYLGFIPGNAEDARAVIEASLQSFDKPAAWLVLELVTDTQRPSLTLVEKGDQRRELAGLTASKAVLVKTGGRSFFSVPIMSQGFVYIAGGGHIAQELCPLLTRLGFRCVIFEDRSAFTDLHLFPDAVRVIQDSYDRLPQQLTITEYDYIIAVTSGHVSDYKAAAFALKTPARYIGIIGSKKKLAFVQGRLREAGFSAAEITAPRVHAPIGLPIQSETPPEVAVSIAAELIAVRAQSADPV